MSTGRASIQVKSHKLRQDNSLSQTAATSTAIENITTEYAALRDEVRLISNKILDGHHKAQGWRLDDRTAVKARRGVGELLRELTTDRGMTWTSIARLCRVSVSAVRKWRHGEATSPENRLEIARLAAFLGLLEELPISEPAAWLAMPMVSGYTITAEDLYIAGHTDQLLDFASGQSDLKEILIGFDEDWRIRYRSEYEVIEAGDGNLSILRRT